MGNDNKKEEKLTNSRREQIVDAFLCILLRRNTALHPDPAFE